MPPADGGQGGCKGKYLGQRLGWARCAGERELRAPQKGQRRVKHNCKNKSPGKSPRTFAQSSLQG